MITDQIYCKVYWYKGKQCFKLQLLEHWDGENVIWNVVIKQHFSLNHTINLKKYLKSCISEDHLVWEHSLWGPSVFVFLKVCTCFLRYGANYTDYQPLTLISKPISLKNGNAIYMALVVIMVCPCISNWIVLTLQDFRLVVLKYKIHLKDWIIFGHF